MANDRREKQVVAMVTEDVSARLDAQRGRVPRSTWVADMLDVIAAIDEDEPGRALAALKAELDRKGKGRKRG